MIDEFNGCTWNEIFCLCRKLVTETKLAKADEAIQKFEKNLLPHSPKRLEATFLIGKADYYIRRATRERMDITQQQRATDFQKGTLNIYLSVMGFKGVRCRSYINSEGNYIGTCNCPSIWWFLLKVATTDHVVWWSQWIWWACLNYSVDKKVLFHWYIRKLKSTCRCCGQPKTVDSSSDSTVRLSIINGNGD